jgi:4-cresol dehydrogenase (hydroxylating) flavoprotein subunit
MSGLPMVDAPDLSNITGHAVAAGATHRPLSLDAVVALVHRARSSLKPLYPVSTGLNWGYGSRSPVVPGCDVVDLGAMNRILNADKISLDNPVAVIEPGVTQRQLAQFLRERCPTLTFNPTGSGVDTSILGNALDRGVGYFGPRVDDVFGLEVVTGAGTVLRTGFRRLGDRSPLAHSHPYGLGPMLDGLFFQGNFGIVTSACFRLIPRRRRQVAVSMALRREADLPVFIDTLARLKREGLLTSVSHIGNRARTHATLMAGLVLYFEHECGASGAQARNEAMSALALVAPDEWTGMAAVTGTSAQVRATVAEVRKRLGGLARVRVVTDRLLDVGYRVAHALRRLPWARANAAAISAMRPLHGLVKGEPTDVAIDNLLWKFGRPDLPAAQLDASNCGLLYVNPALPLDGTFVARFMRQMSNTATGFGFELAVTINVETATSLVAVANLLFDRSLPGEVDRAHACAKALLQLIHREGLEVYRARADMMGEIVSHDDPHWQLVRQLKLALDPDNIIAPGRYNLPD